MLEGAPPTRLRSLLFDPFTFLPSQAVLRLRSRPPSLQGGAPEKLLLQSVDKDFRGRKGCLPIAKLEIQCWDILSTLLGRTGRRAAALGGQMGQEVFSSSVRYTVSQHLEVLLERQGWINIIYLLFLWRRVSEPGYWYILRLYPVQSFLISSCSTWTKVLIHSILITWRKVSLCKWKQGEVVSKKHLPRVGLVVAPVY